jgi:3-hydroxymyristoyl/3-hydroxydecanoyl-(acyl carrier protein) dehydratase
MELLKIRMNAARLKGTAYVDGEVVTEAIIMANIVDRAGA